MKIFSEPREETPRFPARLIPLSWREGQLVPQMTPAVMHEKAEQITILHINDLHASVDGRPDEVGEMRGGLARVATTVRRARAAGPTLVFDLGDIVFGDGTWWNIQGVEAVAILRGKAGCDLATLGNHDLEHGIAGLRELLAGGYPLVSANVQVADEQVKRHIHPAYLIEIGGWRIGVTGLTTLATYDLIPRRILQGITFAEPRQAMLQVVAALEPMVDSIVILSHLGFYENGPGDPDLAAHLIGSKASVILGSHTHVALDPARIMHGITLCNAGPYTANVGEVILSEREQGTIDVQTRLIPQDETILPDPLWLVTRNQLVQTFQPLHETIFPLLNLPTPAGTPFDRVREWTLLARALRITGSPAAILMVPSLYVTGQLPVAEHATLAEIMTTYPNIEQLIAIEISGKTLKEIIMLQPKLLYYQKTRPLRISDESELYAEQVEEQGSYTIITTELICEGGLGWGLTPAAQLSAARSLGITCLQAVHSYLTTRQEPIA